MEHIVWLDDIGIEQASLAGGKAARLGQIARSGLPVSPGFCLTTAAYEEHARAGGVAGMTDSLRADVLAACARLAAVAPAQPLFAVRSSSPVEDLAAASFAGQYDSFLNVPALDVPSRIVDCWLSATKARVVAYHAASGQFARPSMAVLVQAMIPCAGAGVAFSIDPVSGADEIVIEAAAGLAETVASGRQTPQRYVLPRSADIAAGSGPLSVGTLRELRDLILALERLLDGPQDVEWGVHGDKLYIFQSRPITVRPDGDDIFSETDGSDAVWTGGFFNERFSRPVSPLGWSLLSRSIEQFALRDGLLFLGTPGCQDWPLVRLYGGHPYANMRVFQTLYTLFPDALLPEDAARFFVGGDTTLRKQVAYPRSVVDPRLLSAMLRHFVHDPRNWSPLHNWRLWNEFRVRYDAAMAGLRRAVDDAPWTGLPSVQGEIEQWADRLLQIHRWSLTDADIFFSALRRLLCAWLGDEEGCRLAAALTTGDSNASLEMNTELDRLADLVPAELDADLAAMAGLNGGAAFLSALDDFLERYGHRSLSLDIMQPPYADNPSQVLSLIRIRKQSVTAERTQTAEARAQVRRVLSTSPIERVFPLRRLVVEWVAGMARRYIPLREDQRFCWQRALSLLRRSYLRVGAQLAGLGVIAQPDDIFFLTRSEVENLLAAMQPGQDASAGAAHTPRDADPIRSLIARRRRIMARLNHEWLQAPLAAYPPFLQGNRMLVSGSSAYSPAHGRAVSPGLGRGPARVVKVGDDLSGVSAGVVLVAPSADPAWTPLFPHLAGLVLEAGGQLSHAAILAREYGVPAVAGILGATAAFHDGELITVDGTHGLVLRDEPI